MDFCNIEIVKYGNRFFMIDKTVCKPIFISQRVFEVIGEYKSGKLSLNYNKSMVKNF